MRVLAVLVCISACQPGEAIRVIDTSISNEAQVFEIRAEITDGGLTADVIIESAGPGEYFLFASETRPTNPESAYGFQLPTKCRARPRGGCPYGELAGVGMLVDSKVLDATARITLAGDVTRPATDLHYVTVVARPRTARPVPAKVVGKLSWTGCSPPDDPSVIQVK